MTFQLYTASKSPTIQRKKRQSHWVLTGSLAVLALLSFLRQEWGLGTYWGATAVLIGLFYPRYFRWRYKRHYLNHIREHYQNRIGLPSTLSLEGTQLSAADSVGSSQVEWSQVSHVNRLPNHWFIQLRSGVALLVPSSAVDNESAFLAVFTENEIPIENHLNWNW